MAPVQFNVRSVAGIFQVDVDDDDTVKSLGAAIHALKPELGEQLRVLYKGKILDDEATLKDYAVASGDTIAVSRRVAEVAPTAKTESVAEEQTESQNNPEAVAEHADGAVASVTPKSDSAAVAEPRDPSGAPVATVATTASPAALPDDVSATENPTSASDTANEVSPADTSGAMPPTVSPSVSALLPEDASTAQAPSAAQVSDTSASNIVAEASPEVDTQIATASDPEQSHGKSVSEVAPLDSGDVSIKVVQDDGTGDANGQKTPPPQEMVNSLVAAMAGPHAEEPPPELVDQLCSMGFERTKAIHALRASFNNADRAVQLLTEGGSDTPVAAASTRGSVEGESKPSGNGDVTPSGRVEPGLDESAATEEKPTDRVSSDDLLAMVQRLERGTASSGEVSALLRRAADRLTSLENATGELGQALQIVNMLSARTLQGLGGQAGSAGSPMRPREEESPKSYMVKRGDADLQEQLQLRRETSAGSTSSGGALSTGAPKTKEEMDQARQARLARLEAQQAEKKKQQDEAEARSRAREALLKMGTTGPAKPMGKH